MDYWLLYSKLFNYQPLGYWIHSYKGQLSFLPHGPNMMKFALSIHSVGIKHFYHLNQFIIYNLVRGALTRHRRFLVVASQSGFMPTQTTMPQALAAGITQKSQLTTAQSLSYPTYWVIIYQLALWYLHDKHYLICNPWKYPRSFPMPSALSAILYLFLGGSLWLE